MEDSNRVLFCKKFINGNEIDSTSKSLHNITNPINYLCCCLEDTKIFKHMMEDNTLKYISIQLIDFLLVKQLFLANVQPKH